MNWIEVITGKGTYQVKTKCTNCKVKQMTKVKKGNQVSDILENGKCNNCGCQTLEME